MDNKKKSVGYGTRGWILIIACIFTNYMLAAATGDSLNILALRFEENLGWSQASVFLLASYGMFIAAVVSILFSYLLKKWKDSARKIMIIALIITVIGVVLWGFCTKFWQFAILFTIVNIAVNIICYYGANPLINNWFPKKKGSAIGIATTGMNAASFSIVWILMLGWNLMGWHGGFYIFAFIAFIPLVLIVFFIREYPEKCGAFPDNDKTMTREEANKLMKMEDLYDKTSYFTVKNSLKCKQMWQIALSCGFTMACTGIIYQFIPACIDRGFTEEQGIIILTITGILAIPFSILLGIFDQKKGAKKAGLVVAAMCFFGMVCMGIPVKWLIYPAMIGIAFCLGTTNNILMSLTTSVFGRYDYKSVSAVISPIYIFLTAFGVWIIAKLNDLLGGYMVPCFILAGLCVVSFIIILTMKEELIGRSDEDIEKLAAEQNLTN